MELTQQQITILNSFSDLEMEQFEKWYTQVRLVTAEQDKEQAAHNVLSILESLRSVGYTLSADNLTKVLQRLLQNKQAIYKQPEVAPVGARAIQHIGKEFSKPEQVQLITDQVEGGPCADLYVNGKLNHARAKANKPAEIAPSRTSDDQRWTDMANALRGTTHAQNAALAAIVGLNGRDTYEKRIRALKVIEGGK